MIARIYYTIVDRFTRARRIRALDRALALRQVRIVGGK